MSVKWVAVGDSNSIPSTIQWSPDGRTWQDASSGGLSDTGYGVAYGNGSWVAVGDGNSTKNTILWSPDGRTWYDASSGGFGGGGGYYSGYGVAYGNGSWVAVGDGNSAKNTILWSPDGRTWYDASSGGFDDYDGQCRGYGVAYGNGWVAVGDGNSATNSIQWSPDGRTWYDAYSGGFNDTGVHNGYGIAYDGSGSWVAVGRGTSPETSLLWSPDGRTWYDASSGGFTDDDGAYDDGHGIAYNGTDRWVAAGRGTSPETSLLWSPDGRTWYDASSGGFDDGGGGHYGYGVAYDGSGWVAVGDGTSPETNILWSPDGRTWYDASNGGFNQRGFGVASRLRGPNPGPNPDPNPEPLPCFVKGTRILTPAGYKKVEEIESGDYILTSDNRQVKASLYRFTISTTEETAPYTIRAGALGDCLPSRDLHISGNHAVQDSTGAWQIPKFLTNKQVTQHALGETVTYYHIECENYLKDNLVAEGVVAESYNHSKQSAIWKKSATGYVRKQKQETRKDWWRSSAR